MNRISVVGTSCAGKTTLGSELAQRLNARAIDLDDLFWEPNWQGVSDQEFEARVKAAIEAPRWVIAGNYSRVQQHYLELADTVIWLDYSFAVVMSRALRRTFGRIISHEPCCNGNYDSWRGVFSRDSILLWVVKAYRKRRRQYPMKFALPEYAHLRVLRFRSPRETARWLETVVPHQRG